MQQFDWVLEPLQQHANAILTVFGLILLLQFLKPRRRRKRQTLRTGWRYKSSSPKAKTNPFASFYYHAPDHLLQQLQGKQLLTPTELKFFRLLCRLVPEYFVFPQVSFQAVLKVPATLNPFQGWQLRRALGGKHADFLLCRRDTMQIVAFVELDDPSHDAFERRQSDQRRDLMIQHAGYRVERFDVRQWPKSADIKRALSMPALPLPDSLAGDDI